MITPEMIIEEALTWLNTPFHHKAMLKGVGVDCAHFCKGVFVNLGMVERFDVADYPPDWHLHHGGERLLEYVRAYCDQVPEPQAGDIALFRFGRCESHAAIVLEWPRVIHAYFNQGVVYASANDAELIGRHHSFWRVRQ